MQMVYIRVIIDMYDRFKTLLRRVGGDSEHFLVMMGLQFLAFSYLPFEIDELMRSIQEEISWYILLWMITY